MNINNIDLVYRTHDKLLDAKQRLHNLNTFPNMVDVSYGGGSLGAEPVRRVLPVLQEYYQQLVTEYTTQLINLGVDLSPLDEQDGSDDE